MAFEDLYRKDLNLLVALRVLIEEASVTRAAQRLNLSQSAMSRVLGRLRQLTDDPLFVRQGASLYPTQKALALNAKLHQPLAQLDQLLTPKPFDPQTCEARFHIATTDYAMQTILPFALPRIYQEAPNIALEFLPLDHQHLTQQVAGEQCDMAICRPTGDVFPLKRQHLGQVSVFCLLTQAHPLAKASLSLEDYLSFPHAIIAISDGVKALLDAALSQYPSPRVVLRAYHLEAALALTQVMPLIITVPADLAYLVGRKYDLVIKPLPFEFQPFDYSLLWHPRREHDPGQVWLRQLIEEECGRLIQQRVNEMGLLERPI